MTFSAQLPDTSHLDAIDAKKLLRSHLRALRTQQAESFQTAEGKERQRHLTETLTDHTLQAVGDARTVAAYISGDDEPATTRIVATLQGNGVRVLLPVLGPGLARAWAYFRGFDDLEQRAPGRPPEPSGPILPADAIKDAEAVIVPSLAVDGLGTRLGQGGGWYDRMLALIDEDVPTFAMLFHHELIRDQNLPRAEFDIPVKAVITPSEWFLLQGSAAYREAQARASAAPAVGAPAEA